ncbi:hypothetical protein D0Z07_7995 [Hyphodiscus hymeniophilus]|uniref:Uncharacterized protein n=1 Tax=Hyphodiscus hymeniophilus TaxID=353542 RepID=A0A9P6SQF4_9HELO|nr:hypothetical protein D0Z07_7995 [Hyphodiscus hymeniophilus]
MPSIFDQLGSLVHGIFSTIVAAFGSILAVFQSILNAILGVFQTLLSAVGTTISGLAHTFEGLLKFLLSEFANMSHGRWVRGDAVWNMLTTDAGNIVVIGGLVAAFFLYAVYQQRNGRPVTAAPAKKTQ